MKNLLTDGDISYMKLESAGEAEKLDIPEDEGGFDFFHGLGIIGYEQAFKMWLRKFPRPILIVALQPSNTVIGWVFIEEWNEPSSEGMPVYVLRAIEVHPEFRRKGLGKKLLILGLKEINGYMIAKPITKQGERFFRDMGFMSADEFRRVPVDTSKQPRYLILPLYRREKAINEF